ncbi:HD domain-containing protein [Kiloniella sp.]|uniref:HD domain-containing protein n=1 Tax=Kiloniella sp. TaxID=1938587 RepID=UPI003B0178F6
MKTINFTQMIDGTKEEYDFLAEMEKPYLALTADRVLSELKSQGEDSLTGYKITRLEHGLQSATRAYREGADIDWVVGALLHDVGDGLAPQNHDRFSAEVIRPFVREEVSWVVEHHGIFQMFFYGHHYGWDKNAREEFKDHPSFQACADFCERWDQSSFDPDYPTETLEFFTPMVKEVFSRKAYDPEVIKENVTIGLPELTPS